LERRRRYLVSPPASRTQVKQEFNVIRCARQESARQGSHTFPSKSSSLDTPRTCTGSTCVLSWKGQKHVRRARKRPLDAPARVRPVGRSRRHSREVEATIRDNNIRKDPLLISFEPGVGWFGSCWLVQPTRTSYARFRRGHSKFTGDLTPLRALSLSIRKIDKLETFRKVDIFPLFLPDGTRARETRARRMCPK
jgi:hypothetical protein